jgi:ubiquinone biosynthesis protein UbiJ
MNPKVMGAVMKAMALRGKVATATTNASQTVARTLNLATREEVRDLRRTIRRLEEQLGEIEDRDRDRADANDDDSQE